MRCNWKSALLLMLAPIPALANPVLIEFKGTVTQSPNDTLAIRDAATNTITPWTGTTPPSPYQAGDPFTLSFNVDVPTGTLAQSADGIYRYTIIGQSQVQGPTNYLVGPSADGTIPIIGGIDVSGPIAQAGGFEAISGLFLNFDPTANSYSLSMPGGGFSAALFDGPGYLYDPAANSLSPTSTWVKPGQVCGLQGTGCTGVLGYPDRVTFSQIPVSDATGGFWGNFSLMAFGEWLVGGAVASVGGPATDVPEPNQLVLFGLATIFLMWRRQNPARGMT